MAFRFRRFTVEDRQSTLRVGTDSMLLGSWASPGKAQKILDIGTGCGVLALMLAQKSAGIINAIDIDKPSVQEASTNFSASPWPSRLSAIYASVQSLAAVEQATYDFIITNPPYYSNSLKSPSSRINHTRHDEHLPLIELVVSVSRLLTTDGRFSIILPPLPSGHFQVLCMKNGLYPLRKLTVFPKAGAPVKRILTEYSRVKTEYPDLSELTILNAQGKFSIEYLALTISYHDF
jgi:tRNA1Val (adenine37-N6)-methyltransferase